MLEHTITNVRVCELLAIEEVVLFADGRDTRLPNPAALSEGKQKSYCSISRMINGALLLYTILFKLDALIVIILVVLCSLFYLLFRTKGISPLSDLLKFLPNPPIKQ